MRRLIARLARALASLLRSRIVVVQEDICWCGIHHLGDYRHTPPASVLTRNRMTRRLDRDEINRTFWQVGMTADQMEVAHLHLPRMRELGLDDQDAAELLGAAASMFGTDSIPTAAIFARLVQNATDRSHRP